jgi:hypothetical protein
MNRKGRSVSAKMKKATKRSQKTKAKSQAPKYPGKKKETRTEEIKKIKNKAMIPLSDEEISNSGESNSDDSSHIFGKKNTTYIIF